MNTEIDLNSEYLDPIILFHNYVYRRFYDLYIIDIDK